jgi:Flp pilus assembly protein TadD
MGNETKAKKGAGDRLAPVIPLFSGAARAAALFSRAYRLDGSAATWGDAERLYREVVRLAPGHWEAWNNLGVMAYRRGDKAAALHAWGTALLHNGDAAETHSNIGVLFRDEEKYEVASVYLLRAVNADPEMANARVDLALCLQALGRRVAARKHWLKYLGRFPRGEHAEMARKHLGLYQTG